MKKFINRPEHVVEEMLQGLAILYPRTARLAGQKVLIRADADPLRNQQVALISGGGSGHEPAHAGYIGSGMLSAAVLGEIFTSPSTDSVLAAIRAVAGKLGALLIVKNYTGDRLNFGLAAELARSEGIPVEMVIVDDDVALADQAHATGARGLAGTVLIHKLLGAAAAEGKSLADLVAIGKMAVASLSTMGVSFSAGTSPAVGKPSFELDDDEMELGLGIHGEPGAQRTNIQPADQLTETLLTKILFHAKLSQNRRVAVLVNNLGATTPMEIAIIARRAVSFLEDKGYSVERLYAGTFLSSLDMAGISISILGIQDDWLCWLDAATTAPAWPYAAAQRPSKNEYKVAATPPSQPVTNSAHDEATERAIEAACQALIEAEPELTELDRITGDGDLGTSMKRAAQAIQASIATYPLNNSSATLKALAQTLRNELGGSSGPLYGVFFLRCASVLENTHPVTLAHVSQAILEGCQAISELGGAKPGDRTMLDALHPFAEALANSHNIQAALEAADQGVKATAQMKPRLGRSSYLGDRVLGHPDPGARAIAIWLRAAASTITPSLQ